MSMVRFAYVCDKCQKRGEEYGFMPNCRDCGENCCEACDLASERTEDERRKLTMASYNCGTGNMLKAQKVAQGASGYDRIIAALPHVTGIANAAETTDYVIKIERWYGELTAA